MFLFEFGSGNHSHIAYDKQLVVGRILDNSNVRQGGLRRAKTLLLVQDSAHVLVSGQQTFHQDLAFAGIDEIAGLGSRLCIHVFGNDGKLGHVEVMLLAHFLDFFGIADKRSVNHTQFHSSVNRLNGVRIVGVGRYQSFFWF